LSNSVCAEVDKDGQEKVASLFYHLGHTLSLVNGTSFGTITIN
jgi:hypothetical protein